MPVHLTPAHKHDTVLDKGGGFRHFCSVLFPRHRMNQNEFTKTLTFKIKTRLLYVEQE